MGLSPSAVRQNLYRLLDQVIETGVPVQIDRRGHKLRIVIDDPPSKLDRLPSRPDTVVGNSGDLADIEWSGEWTPE